MYTPGKFQMRLHASATERKIQHFLHHQLKEYFSKYVYIAQWQHDKKKSYFENINKLKIEYNDHQSHDSYMYKT